MHIGCTAWASGFCPSAASVRSTLALRTDWDQAARDRKTKEHDALVECVVLGDSAGAAKVMREHIDTSLGATAVSRLGHPEPADEA